MNIITLLLSVVLLGQGDWGAETQPLNRSLDSSHNTVKRSPDRIYHLQYLTCYDCDEKDWAGGYVGDSCRVITRLTPRKTLTGAYCRWDYWWDYTDWYFVFCIRFNPEKYHQGKLQRINRKILSACRTIASYYYPTRSPCYDEQRAMMENCFYCQEDLCNDYQNPSQEIPDPRERKPSILVTSRPPPPPVLIDLEDVASLWRPFLSSVRDVSDEIISWVWRKCSAPMF